MMLLSKQIFEYIRDTFNADLTALYDEVDDNGDPILTHKYDLKWMDKISFNRELTKDEPYKDEINEYIPLIALINDDNIEQDVSIPHDIYQINTTISFMIEENYIDDFYQILKNFIIQNKVMRYSFGNLNAMINMDSGWDDDRERVRGKKMYLADMSVNILVLASTLFSNDITMEIDGIPMENSSVSVINETEMIPSLKKREIVEFLPNTSVVQLSTIAFYNLDNTMMRSLVNHIATANKFNQPVSINIYIYKDTDMEETLMTFDKMFVKSSEIEAQRGTVAIFKASFVTAYII